MKGKYDVFVSYRREGGQDTARIIRDELRAKGLRVFFDVETLRSGKFNEQLLTTIQECSSFILICSPNALDRCSNEDDWVRQELACAFRHGKNVIPVMLRGFSFPPAETLPEDIREVCFCNGLTASHEHFDAFIEKLTQFLNVSKSFGGFLRSLPFNGRRMAAVLTVVLALAGGLIFGGYKLADRFAGPSCFPGTEEEIACMDRLISCSLQNLSFYNAALRIYEDALDELEKYTENRSDYQKQWLFDEYALYCREQILEEGGKLRRLDAMDATLIQDAGTLLKNKINIGDANMMTDVLKEYVDLMADDLSFFAELYHANGGNLRDTALTDSLDNYQRLKDLDRDSIFYAFNEMLLPVDNPDMVKKIKVEYLPLLTSLYARQDWKTDAADIQSQLDSIHNTQWSILDKISENNEFDREQLQALEAGLEKYDQAQENETALNKPGQTLSTEEFLQYMENHIARLESRKTIETILYNDKEGASARYDGLIDRLKKSRDSLAEKYERNQELKAALAEEQARLQALKEELREKFKPLDTDDKNTLWGKGLRFITLKMPDMAEECFDRSGKAAQTEEAAAYAGSAKLFVRSMEETGVTGGCIICKFETGQPRQEAFEIGDILYAVDGQPVYTDEEFVAARGDKDAAISVLRFTEDGSFQKLEINYDASLGRVGILPLNERKK